MSWFSSLGHDISDAFSSVDKFANSINPLEHAVNWLDNNTLGKIPGVGKPLNQLANWGNSHPAEVAALAAGGYGAYTGAAGLLGDAGGVAGDVSTGGDVALGVGDSFAGPEGVLATDSFAGPGAALATDSFTGVGGVDPTAGSAGAVGPTASPMSAQSGGDGSGMSFLPTTGTGGVDGIAQLTPDLASQLGVTSPGGFADLSLGGGADTSFLSSLDGAYDAVPTTSSGFGGVGTDASVAASPDGGSALAQSQTLLGQAENGASSAWDWIKAHPAQAGMLGLSLKNGLSGGQLPASAKQASAASAAEVQQAQGVLASGGQSSPLWAAQKASIDSSIDANLKNAIEAAKQAAANSGMGGNDSGVVQQQIAKLTADANVQKQQLYSQALNQIVSQAVGMLSGGDATLTNIAQMQMRASQEAQQTAAQTAELALGLGSLKTTQPATPAGGP